MRDIIRFSRLYRPYALEIFAGLALSLVTLGAGVALLAVSGWFIAAMGLAGAMAVGMNYFAPAAIIRGLSIVRTAGRYGERLVNHDAALRVTAEFRQRFYRALEPLLPMAGAGLHSADLFDRMRADVETLEKFYLNGVVPLLTALVAMVILFCVLWGYDPALAVAQCGVLVGVGVILPACVRTMAGHDAERMARAGQVRRIALGEMIQGMDELLVYQRAPEKLKQLMAHDAVIAAGQARIHGRESMAQSITLAAMGGVLIYSILLVAPQVRAGSMGGADLAMIALLALAAFEIIQPLPVAFQSLHAARIAARRIYDIVDHPAARFAKLSCGVSGGASCVPCLGFSLFMDGVSFAYDEKTILRGFSMSCAAGDVVAVCGPSGSGKTSLFGLLAGYWAADAGRIVLNGCDGTSMPVDTRRALFGFAPQKPYLFADTMRANLLLAEPGANGESLHAACALTGLSDVIASMPDGLDTYVGERGAGLSGGQIRRLGLARAVLRDAPCLVLDEPTEGLDPAMAGNIMRAVLADAKRKGRAVLLFLHDADAPWLPPDTKIIRF